jgi:hypothetical protein
MAEFTEANEATKQALLRALEKAKAEPRGFLWPTTYSCCLTSKRPRNTVPCQKSDRGCTIA